jgi:hypothetical protein
MQTDRHDKANSHFSQFCERASKHLQNNDKGTPTLCVDLKNYRAYFLGGLQKLKVIN